MRNSLKSRFLQSVAIAAAATAVSVGGANAQTVISPSSANVLNLLSPFLSLNATSTGQTTLIDNLEQAIAVNNNSYTDSPNLPGTATPSIQALAYSDKNLLGSSKNTVTGLAGYYGVAANLAGGLPNQPAATGGTVPGVQAVGGLGAAYGALFDAGVNAYANGNLSSLPNTVALLSSAYSNFTSLDLGVAKNYFANGNASNNANPPYGGSKAVAPAGYTLPTDTTIMNGATTTLPNQGANVYDYAYGVKITDPGQNVYGSSRPVQVTSQNTTWGTINLFDPTAISGLTTNPSFPSGHTTYAYTDSILIGMLVPSEYQAMLARASQFANSRIVLGVHYPLDIIASRALAQYDLAQAFTNPLYISGAATNGSFSNLPGLYNAANAELSPYLCGASTCAADPSNPYAANAQNPYTTATETNAQMYASNLTYNLPTDKGRAAVAAPTGGPDASILLAPIFGGSTAAALTIAPHGGIDGSLATSTISQIIVNTEGAAITAFENTELEYWTRINLVAAIGYFGGVTGTLDTAAGDEVKTDVTVGVAGDKAGSDVIDVTGLFKVDGNLTVTAVGALGFALDGVGDNSQIRVGKAGVLDGAIDLTLGSGFALAYGDAFDLIDTGNGLTDDISGLVFDGSACSSLGGGLYGCGGDRFLLSVSGGDLTATVQAVPEPATWAMMLASFAALGFAGFRRATARATA